MWDMPEARMSRGAQLLRNAIVGREHAAKLLGVATCTVTSWVNGTRSPDSYREKLLEVYGIPVEAWDEMPKPVRLVTASHQPVVAATPAIDVDALTTEDVFRLMRRQCLEDILSPEFKELPQPVKDKTRAILTGIEWRMAKITGEGSEVSPTRLMKSSTWTRLMASIKEHFAPEFPEAYVRLEAILRMHT